MAGQPLRFAAYDDRVRRPATALALILLVPTGCGDDAGDNATPAACLAGANGYLEALEAAPKKASLDGTAIADCLPDEQSPGQIANVGKAMVAAANQLNTEARKQPLGDSTVQLGYLVGVVRERAQETGGIHTDLARRVESAATYIPSTDTLAGGFQQRYEEGIAAGRAS